MDILKAHEIFEIEILEKLKNKKFLSPLVFTGGTMLRLCYGLNRYSTDLDFWFIRKVEENEYSRKLKEYLSRFYEITDAQSKLSTILLEMRLPGYPKRLKIEIGKKIKRCDFQERIAFSKFTTKQVILRVHTLEQSMKNKLDAALSRKDIRDFFDMEFMLRRGIEIPVNKNSASELKKIIGSFKPNDFKVSLGSLLDSGEREYYIKNKFEYLLEKLSAGSIPGEL